jgi:hypothetical protein
MDFNEAQGSSVINTSRKRTFRQLMVVKHNHQLGPNTFHLLVRSTAPDNAEEPALSSGTLPKSLLDQSNSAIEELRDHLRAFLQHHEQHQATPDRLGTNAPKPLIKLALNIHGYSTPLLTFASNAYEISDAKFNADLNRIPSGGEREEPVPLDDYVIFIDYSWPSEHALSLPVIGSLRAMPMALWVVLLLAVIAGICGWPFVCGGLIGLVGTLLLLRQVTYFRDRERAAGYGVYDGVELVRWMHRLIKSTHEETIKDSGQEADVELNIMAHSMGCFVATQLVRTLCNVFDPAALRHLDQSFGPFAEVDPCGAPTSTPTKQEQNDLRRIGTLFTLGQLVLAAPDIPIWALSSGRSNALLASLRRFKEVFIFSNDADMVLRLASTLANFFVFPSETRQGGYRLGNIVDTGSASDGPSESIQRHGRHRVSFRELGFHGLRSGLGLTRFNRIADQPFYARLADGAELRIINCTDYRDRQDVFELMKSKKDPSQKHEELIRIFQNKQADNASTDMARLFSPRLAASGCGRGTIQRYLQTLIQHFITKKLDSHGGYFQGPFCLDLLYQLLLWGSEPAEPGSPQFPSDGQLQNYGLTWNSVFRPEEC